MNHIRKTLCFIFTLTINPAFAQDETDILQIYDQFVTSNAAAGLCEKPGQTTMMNFMSNFQMVTALATEKLATQYPDYTKASIAETLKARSDLITSNIKELVENKGCDYPGTQEVIKRFHAQADWKPAK